MRDDDKPQPFMLTIIGWSSVVLLCVLALFGSVLLHDDVPNSLAVDMLVASDGDGFSTVKPGRRLSFPTDYGKHDDFRQEWWYVTANVSDKQGNQYGVQWTLFRTALSAQQGDRWDNTHVFMAHAVLTTKTETFAAERFARGGIGQTGVTSKPFNAWLDNWEWRSQTAAPFPAELTAQDDDFSFDLNMVQSQAEIMQGDQGYSRKHATKDVASYYFSVPAVVFEGTVTINGENIEVSGKGWVDREWSTQALSDDQRGWDWFSLQLDDGQSLMVVQVRSEQGPYRFGSLTAADGSTRTLDHDDINMVPTSFSKMPTGRHLPTEWQIQIADVDMTITTSPVNANNWLPFAFPYWEGPINVLGSSTGVGFMEATGY
ncbi:ABC transporter [Enterovibrio norvegicus FF-33]|uniref:lipocalin-like domain-containing protein n=1 Tax=Enterovibrio TaxID=188143 RepID=UPI0002EBE2D0|nr:lipocalin-like domain-containing protein [Enterovibrio norvegicus]OEE65904.1 ABC transporter [Enterovibrio norvegicus FF-33]